MEEVVFDPIYDKNPSGVLLKDNQITFSIKVLDSLDIKKVVFCLRYEKTNYSYYPVMDFVKNENHYNYYRTSLTLKDVGLYWYHFDLYKSDDSVLKVNKSSDYKGYIGNDEEFPLTVIEKEIPLVDKYLSGSIYQIFVDRFNRIGTIELRDGFVYRSDWGGCITKNTKDRTKLNYEVFGGNLKGVIDKLEYIASLGVTIIYLCPIFLAPSNHKYDTSDYSRIDPMFGDMKILKQLIDKAQEYGIGIVLDGVFNHTGSDSIYFNKEHRFNTTGAYNSTSSIYYDWYDFSKWPNKYRCWWGIKTLPSLNQKNKSLQAHISHILKEYMKMGLLGFRLDVVDELGSEYLHCICNAIRSVKSDALIIGEVWEDASTKIAYSKRRGYFLGNELNSVMNYPLKDALITYATTGNASPFNYATKMIQDNYPNFVKHNLMNLIGSHDTRRIYSILSEHDEPLKRLKLISALQYGFYGHPSIFYGDEVGLKEDPPDFSRKCYPWGNEDKEILAWFRLLGQLRQDEVFKKGNLRLIKASDGVIVFTRYNDNQEVIFLANMSKNTFTYNLDNEYTSYLTNKKVKQVSLNMYDIEILKRV